MGTIKVNPGALMDYADWVRPKVLRVDTAAYDDAIAAYLSAPDNDFGTGGVHNLSGTVEAHLEDAERHNRVAEQFADAVSSLDADKARVRDGNVTLTLDHAAFMGMRVAWRRMGVGEDLVEQAEDIQAVQYATDMTDVLADHGLDSDHKRAAVERLLADMEADGIDGDPSAQEAFVRTLGAEGLTALNDAAAFAESYGGGSWLGPITQVSACVATAANRLSTSDLHDFVGELPGSVLFMNARLTPWDDEATTIAVDRLWGNDDWPMTVATWPASFVATMGHRDSMANWDALPTTWRAAAAGLLADNPEVAHAFLTATDEAGRDRLRDMVYDVDHALAGDALVAGLKTHPLDQVDPTSPSPDLTAYNASESAFAWVVQHHNDTFDGPLWFDGEDSMTDGARVGLAHVSSMFMQQMQAVATSGAAPLEGISKEELVEFFDQVFDSQEAQQVVASNLGTYLHLRWEETAAYMEVTYDGQRAGIGEMTDASFKVDKLSNIFTEALIRDGAEQTERANFMIATATRAGNVVAGIGLTASPFTAGQSAWIGAGVGLAIDRLSDGIPVPAFDAGAHAGMEEQQFSLTAMDVLMDHHEVLDNPLGTSATPFNLDDADVAILQDPDTWDTLRNGTPREQAQMQDVLLRIKDRAPTFSTAVNQMTGELRWADEGQFE